MQSPVKKLTLQQYLCDTTDPHETGALTWLFHSLPADQAKLGSMLGPEVIVLSIVQGIITISYLLTALAHVSTPKPYCNRCYFISDC